MQTLELFLLELLSKIKQIMNKLTYEKNKLLGKSAKRKSIAYSQKQVWYGRVNDWKDLKTTERDIICCFENGLSGYMIEMNGDLPGSSGAKKAWSKSWLKDIETKYAKLVKMTRAAGLWLFVSVVNDNMGKGKYGDTSPKLEKVMAQAQQLAQIIKKNGAGGVIVQPVAETQTAAGKNFETYCKKELSKFHLVYNGSGGFPKTLNGFEFRAVHPKSTTTTCPKDAFAVSDHGLIIVELAKDGKYDGTVNEKKADTWFNTVFKKCGCRVTGYYAFQRKKHDKDTIKILGKLMKKYK